MTTPGAPTSPGLPPFEHPAQHVLNAARMRVEAAMRGRPILPPELSQEQRDEALKDAHKTACFFCAGWHAGNSTPACPRLATFKLNGDGAVIEGSFWPDGVSDTVTETLTEDGKETLVKTVATTHSGWDTSKCVFVADAAEKAGTEEGESDG